jgi:hypothetical protein
MDGGIAVVLAVGCDKLPYPNDCPGVPDDQVRFDTTETGQTFERCPCPPLGPTGTFYFQIAPPLPGSSDEQAREQYVLNCHPKVK